MTAQGAENQSTGSGEMQALESMVNRQTAAEIIEEFKRAALRAQEVKLAVDSSVETTKKAPDEFTGDPQDKDTAKGKAKDVKQSVQKILIAAKKMGTAATGADIQTHTSPFASTLLRHLSDRISYQDISEQTAPYLHQVIDRIIKGDITTVDGLQQEFAKLKNLQYISPLYERVQDAFVSAATDLGESESTAKQKFDVKDPVQATTPEALQTRYDNQREPTPAELSEMEWQQTWKVMNYSSFYNESEDKALIKALHSVSEFTKYTDQLKKDIAGSKNPSDPEVGKAASIELENRVVGLFGKLYTMLDHEKPKEFFDKIEQEDPMYGVLRTKNELKRRIRALANEFERVGEQAGSDKLDLYQRAEMRAEVSDVLVGKDGVTKPWLRIKPQTEAKSASTSHFIHYVDQLVDSYLDARRYTHNARAIFLHPVDHEKGFYSQLARFSEEMTMVDFDQMFALPDGNLFQDALWLYDKHVEETFAKNDWRHDPKQFEKLQNSVRTQIEEDVLEQLKMMHKGNVSEARLEAALTMAVGASRGMFLTEIEKASYADPHLTPDGKATFASYYNNDNSALLAFNPMHHHYRWQTTNTLDPILFTPVSGFKGTQAFWDHRAMWGKMQAYKDSFIKGRGDAGIQGETLFADFLVNVGKVGGPLQRKGWRTTFMLEQLYYKDKEGFKEGTIKSEVIDHVKSWKRFENIGYEVAQDFVAKLSADFASSYPGYKGSHGANKEENSRYVRQKSELFSYLYGKYFDGGEEGLRAYLGGLHRSEEQKVLSEIRSGKLKPHDIRAEVESRVTKTFLNRTLARLVAQRIPTKILRLDRDRLSKSGRSRWRTLAEEMFPKSTFGAAQPEHFDRVIRDLMMAEQMLRRAVSNEMKGITNPDEQWKWGDIAYRMTPDRVRDLLAGKMDAGRIDNAIKLLQRIQQAYVTEEFLDKEFVPLVKDRDTYKFTFGLEEVDLSFIPWRAAGNRVLPRAIGDLSSVEMNVGKEISKLPGVLKTIAVDGKADFTPVIEIMTKAYNSIDAIIGTDYAHEVVHNIAALTISYFKKDMRARALMGVFGLGRKNSIAAERVGSGLRVWEWDSSDIDRFCYALESRGLLPLKPYNPVLSPSYEPMYLNVPFVKTPIKLPAKMKVFGKEIGLFRTRKADFKYTIKDLRTRFGGTWKDKAFDVINKYLPLVMAWLLWKYLKDALDEAEGKKKK
ncbi:MAG: hypothetical protein WC489_00020 [Patescibacteria group bacterium]